MEVYAVYITDEEEKANDLTIVNRCVRVGPSPQLPAFGGVC